MIPRDASPIGHVPPMPRIGMNELRPADPNIIEVDINFAASAEQDRICDLVRQASEGNG